MTSKNKMPNKKAIKKKKQQILEKSKDRKESMEIKQAAAKPKISPKIGKRCGKNKNETIMFGRDFDRKDCYASDDSDCDC
jgi:hypothetical protein